MVFLLLIVLAIVAGLSLDASRLLALFAISAAVACLLSYVFIRKTGFIAKDVVEETETKRWRAASYPWIITSLVWDLFIELHIILTSFLAAPAQVAILHIAFRFRVLAGFGMRSLYALFLPRIIALNVQEKPAELNSQLQLANLLAFIYASGVMVFFILFSPLLLGLFGQEFEQGWLLLPIVSSTILVRAIFGPAPAILSMTGHQRPSVIVMLASLGFSLATSLALYPLWGIHGIAASYAVANFLGSVVLWLWAKKLTGIDSSLFSLIGTQNPVSHFRNLVSGLK
jgi:O-antigen/teichoic acid export membrane protein